jgi:hypothetical protein
MEGGLRQKIKDWIQSKDQSRLAWQEWQIKLGQAQQCEKHLLQEIQSRGLTHKRIQLGERGTVFFQEQKEYGALTHQFLREALKEYCQAVEQKQIGLDAKSAYQFICRKRPIKKEWKVMM